MPASERSYTVIEKGTELDHHAEELERQFIIDLRAQNRRNSITRILLNLFGILIFLAIWQVMPLVLPNLNPDIFPPPSLVLKGAWPMIKSGELLANIGVSVGRAFVGFIIASILAILVGVAMARVRVVRELSEPIMHGFRSIPVIALVPLAILWFGIGETSKIALIACGAFFPVWINTFIGIRDVHPIYLRSAACLGASPLKTLFLVALPAALPMILAGLRQAIAISLIVLVAAELSGATQGVAHMMSLGYQLFKVDIMFIGLVTLGALGFLADRLFVWLSAAIFPWYQSTR
jgi:ABC-type nitrate/sulfonate/bicarbonate transport system permease component